MPTLKALLAQARAKLSDTETPSLDARLLLQHVTGLSHADVVADPDRVFESDVVELFDALVARRAAYEPVTRILGTREFYGRNFRVTPDVLDPRADTETIVEVCLNLLPVDAPLRILDLGTGSGILAITLLVERKRASGMAVDLSVAALRVAEHNAVTHGVTGRISFVESSWFSKVEGTFDLIVSNPPYIPAAEISALDIEVKDHDPHLALVGGHDGLDCYRAIALEADGYLVRGGTIVVEIGTGQADDVARIFAGQGLELFKQARDLGGHVRCLAFRRAAENL
jgi:release factor glutamine methyltransferase